MSNFHRETINPRTGQPEQAAWIDGALGPHRYGVQFADGGFYPADEVEVAPIVRRKLSFVRVSRKDEAGQGKRQSAITSGNKTA